MSAPKPAEPAEGRIDDGGPYNGIDIRGIVDALIQSAFDDGESGVEEYGERVRECRDDLLRAIGRLTTPTAERQASAVRELVAKWREQADCAHTPFGVAWARRDCADELEAALADAAPVGDLRAYMTDRYLNCTAAPPVAAEAVASLDDLVAQMDRAADNLALGMERQRLRDFTAVLGLRVDLLRAALTADDKGAGSGEETK